MEPEKNLDPHSPLSQTALNWRPRVNFLLTVIIVILAAVVAYLLLQRRMNPNSPLASAPSRVVVVDNPYDFKNVQSENQNQQEIVPAFPNDEYMKIKWLPEWVPTEGYSNEYGEIYQRVRAGKVTEGPYKDLDVYIEIVPGMGTSYRHYVKLDGKEIYFDQNNIKIYGIDDLPGIILLPGTSYTLKKNYVAWTPYKEIVKKWKIFTHPTLGDFYLTEEGCFVVELPDHTAITYDYVIPFIHSDTRELQIQFADGNRGSDPYTYTRITGCGALCMYLAQEEESQLKPQERLAPAGTANNGEILYEFIDKNSRELRDLYNDKNTVPYYSTEGTWEQTAKSKYTYEQFLSYHPLLYWKDPLGRWVEFRNDRFQVAAEMCKPVIYLYPEKPVELSVRVFPNGGFTFTEPNYGNGWEVLAKPDGTVVNLSDQKPYPYLFWEGIGINYPAQDKGFVVARQNLEAFLSEKISYLGLEGREAKDFMDYWLPRLDGLNKPYVKISFLKKEQMDEIAPLSIFPHKPTSVIRVMLTASGLEKFEELPVQELPNPQKRQGFTLVEWGGAVLR